MTSEIDEFRTSLVAAVQAELERHASAVVAEVDRLRADGQVERQGLRDELTAQLAALAQSIEQANTRSDTNTERAREALEQRLTDVETRNARRVDEVTASVEGLVHEAVRPLITDVGQIVPEASR